MPGNNQDSGVAILTNMKRIPVAPLANGTELAIYTHELIGKLGDGPTMGVSGVIHGNEPTGTHAVMELARRYSDGNFRGRLLLLPVANPIAFEANLRSTPMDSLNLNRVFPGDPEGWITEQLAALITEEFLNKIDVYVDLHSGTDRPTVDYIYINNDEALSRSFGSTLLYKPAEGRAGTVYEATSKSVTKGRGVPGVTVELGGGVIDQTPYIGRTVDGIQRMMRHVGMLDGESPPLPPQIIVRGIALVRPRAGGFLYTDAPPLGEEIAGGEVLGRVVSPYTFEELDVVINPVEKGIMILSHLTTNLVQPGDYGYMVGDMEGCERYPGG